jgi:putative membrane protein insertion efficiency factor
MVGTVRWTVRLALRGYQVMVSPADGRSCRFFPSCSTYMLQAVHRHGPLIGVVMGLERVQRNHDGWQYTPCRYQGVSLLLDPVEDNDWWFRPRSVRSDEPEESP